MISNTRELELPRGLLEEVSLVQRAKTEVVRFLPAWMFFFYGCLLLNTGLTNFDPPRADFTHNAIFPLGVFVAFYLVRAVRAPEVKHRWTMALTALALAVIAPAINIAYHQPA